MCDYVLSGKIFPTSNSVKSIWKTTNTEQKPSDRAVLCSMTGSCKFFCRSKKSICQKTIYFYINYQVNKAGFWDANLVWHIHTPFNHLLHRVRNLSLNHLLHRVWHLAVHDLFHWVWNLHMLWHVHRQKQTSAFWISSVTKLFDNVSLVIWWHKKNNWKIKITGSESYFGCAPSLVTSTVTCRMTSRGTSTGTWRTTSFVTGYGSCRTTSRMTGWGTGTCWTTRRCTGTGQACFNSVGRKNLSCRKKIRPQDLLSRALTKSSLGVVGGHVGPCFENQPFREVTWKFKWEFSPTDSTGAPAPVKKIQVKTFETFNNWAHCVYTVEYLRKLSKWFFLLKQA